jgi:hypothetical protein
MCIIEIVRNLLQGSKKGCGGWEGAYWQNNFFPTIMDRATIAVVMLGRGVPYQAIEEQP